MGQQAPRLAPAHGRTEPIGAGLVGGGEHNAAAHDDWPITQAGVVALLDRGEERVEIGVEDAGQTRHEHMFAHAEAR